MTDLRESVARALMTVRAQMPGGGLDGPELPVLDMDPDFDDLPLHGGQGSEDDAITQEAVLRLADAALRAVADAGFVIVPKEPTPEIITALCNVRTTLSVGGMADLGSIGFPESAETIYRAAIAAALKEMGAA